MRKFLACLVAVPAMLAAQSNTDRIVNDRYGRSHDYDLVHQSIALSRFNWDSASFDGVVGTTLRALRQGFDSVVLDAGPLLHIDAVKGAAGFDHIGDTLVVRLPKPVGFGDTVRFTISYHGRVASGRGLTFIEADSTPPRRPRQLWSQGESENNHFWFPTYDFPNDKATWDLSATVPKAFTVVSNGRLALDRLNADGTRTTRWRQEQPSATYLVSLIVAPLVKVADRWRGIPVDYYVYREDSSLARPLFRRTPDMIETFSRLTGVRYPWPKYAQTTVADFFGGMENVSATTLVDWMPDATAYADRPWYSHELIAHELAHQWFGDYVTTANWANMWLNEGFATFMPGAYWRSKLGAHAAEDYYLGKYREAVEEDRDRRMPLASQGSNNVYPKGAMVLEMLRKYLGDERFWAGINRYLTTHAYGVAVSDDLRQAFLDATGENLSWFWDQWIYQAGLPQFNVSVSWDSASTVLTLVATQTQSDTAVADSTGLRYSVPQAFRMPVTIRVETASGALLHREWIENRVDTVSIVDVRSAPRMVVFDDGNTIYKDLTFPQPVEWLATQLERDADLWNRSWVIGQLRSRAPDSVAIGALSRCATGADYFLTRLECTEALTDASGPGVLQALTGAVRDTSAQVREAAIGALGGQKDETVKGVVRSVFEHDTSYHVRAAALHLLARLDPAAAPQLIRAGLVTPSYQNVIQDAALSAAAQSGDTTLLGEVDARIGDQDNPAYLLAGFATRGSTRALEFLIARLNDKRPKVRSRVLDALSYVRPEIALEPLKAAEPDVRDEGTRNEVGDLIERLSRPAPAKQ